MKRADVLIEHAKQGRVERESFRASQKLCQQPQGDKFFETLSKVIDVMRADKPDPKKNLKSVKSQPHQLRKSSSVKVLFENSAQTNRLWGTHEDRYLAAILRYRRTKRDLTAPDHSRKTEQTSGQNSFKLAGEDRLRVLQSVQTEIRPVNLDKEIRESVISIGPVHISAPPVGNCAYARSSESVASKASALTFTRQKEEAKRWWADKVANERHMMQMRNSLFSQ